MNASTFGRAAIAVALLLALKAPVARAQTNELAWPRTLTSSDGMQVTVYQPQVDSWEYCAVLDYHMAIELQPHTVASLSLWQGLTMTERAQRNLAAHPELTQSIVTRPAVGCSPEFPGRVITALATDRELMDLSGGTFITAELA